MNWLMLTATTGSVRAGVWRLADPKISLASMASLFLGTCAAARGGPIEWEWLIVAVLGIFALEVAKNASGEVVDFNSGTDLSVAPEDRSPFSGGKRVLVDKLLSRPQTVVLASLSYAVGILLGLAIVVLRQPEVLWFGLAGVGLAFFYHAPPLKLSYRGFGEAAVAFSYGPLIAVGTYLVLRGTISREIVLVSIPLGLLIGAFLWINEFPDYRADRSAGKRNLVVRLGRRRAAAAFPAILGTAACLLAMLPLLGVPEGVLVGGLFVVPGGGASVILIRNPETTARIIPAQALTLLAFLVMAAGTGLGLLLVP